MKQYLITSIKIIISLMILGFLVHTSSLSPRLLLDLFKSPLMLLITLLLYFIVIAISTFRWTSLNKVQDIHLSYRQTLLPTYLGVAFNNLLPGGVGGDFFRFYLINKTFPVRKSAIMASILFDRITGLMGIFSAVIIVFILNYSFFSQHKLILYFALLCLIPCVAVLALYIASILLPPSIGFIRLLTSRLTFLEPIRIYRHSKKAILKCLFASLIIQFLIAFTCMLIASMMNIPAIPFSHYIMAIAVTQLANLIPIAPGGIGVGEMAFANVLWILNPHLDGNLATIFLAYRLLGILTYLPGVAVFIFDRQLLRVAATRN
jgi:uncharacterized membrane protein YbhN (UPF0104 family)